MKANKVLSSIVSSIVCLLFFWVQTVNAAEPKIDFEFSPIPANLETLTYRLDNLDSSVEKLDYALNHLDKNIVLLQIIPLDEAHASFDDVLEYAVSGLTEALNLNYITFRHTLSEAAEFYSPAAYQQLHDFLAYNKVTHKTKFRKITNNAIIMSTPVVVDTAIETVDHPKIPNKKRKVYTWEVEIPLYIQTYSKGKLLKTLEKNVKLKIARCSVEYSVDQMLIDNIIFEDYKFEDYKLGV
jgi:hypothetical protein